MVREGLIGAALLVAAVVAPACAGPARAPATSPDEPPPAPREFRAAWVSTVANIDWPSRKGLSNAEAEAEIVRVVDRAAELHLNALVLQVRPSADAIYPSELEPWSEFLTGEQGRAPSPAWDPLRTWVDEAHRRGLELHAWFNPYRARHKDATSPPSATHIARTHPSVVKEYGEYLWMDPGEPQASERTLAVILDVVRRYDVDGVHIDDYFYPYPVVRTPPVCASSTLDDIGGGAEADFPDEPSWQAYVARGGTLARADWRRKNVSDLIERIYEGAHREKRWVKFGISPFGVGRPGRRPPGIAGFSQYDKLYADVELWLEKGWLDYLSPQLYWRMDHGPQAFAPLFDYWMHANARGRHVWPGLYTSRVGMPDHGWPADEVLGQIATSRDHARHSARGQVHFSMVSLLENRGGIADRLKSGPYAVPALVPPTPWLGGAPPEPPRLVVEPGSTGGRVTIGVSPAAAGGSGDPVAEYAVWARYGREWRFSIVPATRKSFELDARALDRVVASAVSRVGAESRRVALAASDLRGPSSD